MRRLTAPLAVAALLLAAPPAYALDLDQIGGTTFAAPVHVSGPPGDATRVLVVEQGGTIRLVKNGVVQGTPYLDIDAKVDNGGGEEGLLSMAFPPDHATTGRFYVFYTAETGTTGSDLVVEEHVVAPTGDTALPGSNEIIRIPHRNADNHNGGQLQFGPDGNLWISTGDGGSGNDPWGNGQNRNTLLGKILRIDPRPGGGYDIPPGNPYGSGGGAPEIWAIGLRNPWRFSFDRLTGDLWIGDVGQGYAEEIDRASAPDLGCGANYGWVAFEADQETGLASAPASHHEPLIVRTRTEGWRAIAGGYVLRDQDLPDGERGHYVYGDFFVDQLWLANPNVAEQGTAQTETVDQLSAFGEDGIGRVYATSLGGPVYRLTGSSPAPVRFTPPGCTPSGGVSAPAPPPIEDPAPQPPPSNGTTPTGAQPAIAPLRLFAGTAPRQRALDRRRVFVRLRCSAACDLRARARGLRPRTLRLEAGRTRTVLLRLGPRSREALRDGESVLLRIRIRATGVGGEVVRRILGVRALPL